MLLLSQGGTFFLIKKQVTDKHPGTCVVAVEFIIDPGSTEFNRIRQFSRNFAGEKAPVQ